MMMAIWLADLSVFVVFVDLLEQLFVQMNGRNDGGCEEKECLKGRRGSRVFIVCFRRYWCYRGTRAIHKILL